jgi:hypothetical protein
MGSTSSDEYRLESNIDTSKEEFLKRGKRGIKIYFAKVKLFNIPLADHHGIIFEDIATNSFLVVNLDSDDKIHFYYFKDWNEALQGVANHCGSNENQAHLVKTSFIGKITEKCFGELEQFCQKTHIKKFNLITWNCQHFTKAVLKNLEITDKEFA